MVKRKRLKYKQVCSFFLGKGTTLSRSWVEGGGCSVQRYRDGVGLPAATDTHPTQSKGRSPAISSFQNRLSRREDKKSAKTLLPFG